MQRNWIGQSEGAEVDFALASQRRKPGNRSASSPPGPTRSSARPTWCCRPSIRWSSRSRRRSSRRRSRRTRRRPPARATSSAPRLAKTKTGVFTGAYAINPVNDEQIPIWIADYVLASYGTGAIMAVPGHDERDFEFAKVFDLPIIRTVQPPDGLDAGKAYLGDGAGDQHRASSNGLPTSPTPRRRSSPGWRQKGSARGAVNYKLRDWLFSRQRYWGEPFPILHEVDAGRQADRPSMPLSDERAAADVCPTWRTSSRPARPEPPLVEGDRLGERRRSTARRTAARRTRCRSGPARAGTYLRYLDPKNDKAFCDPAKLKYWLPVDLYVGGAEHAVLHLLYARFWHKVLFDRGHVPHAGAVPAAGQPGDDPGRDRVPHHAGGVRGEQGRRWRSMASSRSRAPKAEDEKKSDTYVLKVASRWRGEAGQPAGRAGREEEGQDRS